MWMATGIHVKWCKKLAWSQALFSSECALQTVTSSIRRSMQALKPWSDMCFLCSSCQTAFSSFSTALKKVLYFEVVNGHSCLFLFPLVHCITSLILSSWSPMSLIMRVMLLTSACLYCSCTYLQIPTLMEFIYSYLVTLLLLFFCCSLCPLLYRLPVGY